MPLKYYPLTRIIPNLYTRGTEFKTPDGKPYSGKYYKTYDGNAYTGINPVVGTNLLLIPLKEGKEDIHKGGRTPNRDTEAYANIQKVGQSRETEAVESGRLTELKPYYPIPLPNDYARGYFTRYFAKTVSGPGYVFEISQADWTAVQNGNMEENVLGYETISMLWQLTGPLEDRRVSQYQIQGGVFTTNKRVTENTAKRFVGLLAFIGGDYTKFAKIT